MVNLPESVAWHCQEMLIEADLAHGILDVNPDARMSLAGR